MARRFFLRKHGVTVSFISDSFSNRVRKRKASDHYEACDNSIPVGGMSHS